MSESRESKRFVGRSLPVKSTYRFVQGLGRYVNDLPTGPNTVHLAFVRSSVAHARITKVDTTEAEKHPECIAVITAEDLTKVIKGNYWAGITGTSTAQRLPLAEGKTRLVGEPVAAVVSTSRYAAEDIADLVEVEYEELPPVLDPAKALSDPPALLYEEWGNNVYYHKDFEAGDVDGAFAGAPFVTKRHFTAQRHTGTPMETRGIIAEYDPIDETLQVHVNHQDVYLIRGVLANLFDMGPSSIRVIAPDAGGGFGVKLPVYPEEATASAVAILLRRPVKWISDRREDLLGTSQHRDLHLTIEVAHDENGRILAVRQNVLSDAGAYGIPARGNTVEGIMASEDLITPYDVRNYAYTLNVVMTNKPPTVVYRGVAQPVTIFAMERMMDEIAQVTGKDRAEVRKVNYLKEDQFPYEVVTGYVVEPGQYAETLDRALDLVDYDKFPAFQAAMREQGRYFGLGFSTGNEAASRGGGWYGKRGLEISAQEGCHIKMDQSGRLLVQMGTTTQGQGLDTTIAQIVADELGVDVADVRVMMGDTQTTPYGGGTWASRCMVIGGTAAHRAALSLKEKILTIAADQLEANVDDLVVEDRRVLVRGNPASNISLRDIAHLAYYMPGDLPEGLDPGLEVTRHFEPPTATFPNSVHAIVIEVDMATCQLIFHKYLIVHDSGTVVNPMIVDGQLLGGTAQGIGGTIFEHSKFDEAGQPLATTFMDYLVPTTLDMPKIEIEHLSTPSPYTALGVKGVGESGTVFAPGAIAAAVTDALRPLGIEVNRLELSPSAVYELIASAQTVPQPA